MIGRKKLKLSNRFIKYSQNTDLNEVINNPNCTFLGHQCDQPFTAFYVWEKFFFDYSSKIKRFIELGCDTGGMSVYFSLWCHNIGAEYVGFDFRRKSIYKNTKVKLLVGLADRIMRGNLYSVKIKSIVESLIVDSGMTVVFSDCIDKPWEFENFAPLIKTSDVIVVHDWDRAIFDSWVKSTLERIEPYKLLYEEERIKLNTLTRFFLKE